MYNIQLIFFCLMTIFGYSQIGINTTSPSIDLAIVNNASGFHRNSEHHLSLRTNNEQRININEMGVGINQPSPAYKFDVNAKNPDNTDGFIRFQNLPTSTTDNDFLVISDEGLVGKKTITSHAGQFIRIGVNADNISISPNEQAVRFKNHNSANKMGTAPYGGLNFHNTIAGATFLEDVILPSGSGSPARTTDQIELPEGVYRLTFKYTGKFQGANDNNHLDIKIIIDNNEYSFANCVISGNGHADTYKSGIAQETIVLKQKSKLDFTFLRDVAFHTVSTLTRKNVGQYISYQSYILIEKLQ